MSQVNVLCDALAYQFAAGEKALTSNRRRGLNFLVLRQV